MFAAAGLGAALASRAGPPAEEPGESGGARAIGAGPPSEGPGEEGAGTVRTIQSPKKAIQRHNILDKTQNIRQRSNIFDKSSNKY